MSPFIEEITKQDVIDQLAWDDSLNVNEIFVIVQDGIVQLKGTVPNYAAKLAAEGDAFRVSGVVGVENHLRVEFPPSLYKPGDTEVRKSVEKLLALNSKIDESRIKVEVNNGIASLNGYVSTFWEKYTAADIATTAHGVLEVVNHLEVKSSSDKTIIDIDIENDIKNTFKRSELIDEENIQVSVNAGVVHLSGTATNQVMKDLAYKIAVYTSGVQDVTNEIKIG
jgi:osmotically-inducible protein OsmY